MDNDASARAGPPNGAAGRTLSRDRQTRDRTPAQNRRQTSQKKTKSKQKMRDLNRRAENREAGGDMDAFVDSKPPVPPSTKPAQSTASAPPTVSAACAVPAANAKPASPAPAAPAPTKPPPAASAPMHTPAPAAVPRPTAAAPTPAADATTPAAAATTPAAAATTPAAAATTPTAAATTPTAAATTPAAAATTPAAAATAPAAAATAPAAAATAPAAAATAPAAAATAPATAATTLAAAPPTPAVPAPASVATKTSARKPAEATALPVKPLIAEIPPETKTEITDRKPEPAAAAAAAITSAAVRKQTPEPAAAAPVPTAADVSKSAPAAEPKAPAVRRVEAPVFTVPEPAALPKPIRTPATAPEMTPAPMPVAMPTPVPVIAPAPSFAVDCSAKEKTSPPPTADPVAQPEPIKPPPSRLPLASAGKAAVAASVSTEPAVVKSTLPPDAAKPERDAKQAMDVAKPDPAPENDAAPAAETAKDQPSPKEDQKLSDDTLEEGEIPDDEDETPPTVNGTEEPPPKSKMQLDLERMKAESLAISKKMSYNRDDLLKLQGHPLSQKRPTNLPDLPSIVRKDRSAVDAQRSFAGGKSRSMGPTSSMSDFPGGFKTLPKQQGYRGGRSSQQGRRDMGAGPGGGPPGMQRRIEISINREVKLHSTENAWKPSSKAAAVDADEDAESKVIRAFKGILNKITPNSIDRLKVEIKSLKLDTRSMLDKMITTLFDKAVDEPMYADQYASICVDMGKTEVIESAEKEGKVSFRKLLLTQCQREFEKDKTGELNRETRMAEICAETDERVKKEKTRQLDEESRKMRLRSNGNIRFIGELFKLGMLTDRIMQQCIVKLMKDSHEDSYECLCKLMTTIGQKLEQPERAKNKPIVDLFSELGKRSKDKMLSSRIRFMMQDLIDMRNNKWVNTRTVGQAKPTTIEEVHKQAQRQAVEQQAALVQAEDRRRNERGGPDRRRIGGGGGGGSGRDGRGSQGGAGPDGWSTVKNNRFDPNRMLTAISSGASQLESNRMTLGPGGGSWGCGAKAGAGRRGPGAASVASGGTEVRTTPNMFSMLSDDAGGPASLPMQPMRLAPGGGRGGRMADSGRAGRGSDGGAAAPAPPPAPAGPVLNGPATMDSEKMNGKVRMICSEFIEQKDYKLSAQDIEELLHADTVAQFVTECLEQYVDAKNTEQRHMVGELHRHMFESGHMTTVAYLAGATQLLDVATDLAVDIPSVWTNLAELLAPVAAAGGAVTLGSLAKPAAALITDGCGDRFVLALLKRMVSLRGADRVRALVPAGQPWAVFFGDKSHVEPLVNAQLGFLVSGANVPLSAAEAPAGSDVRTLLTCVQREPSLERWIVANVPPEKRAGAQFVTDLVCAICFDAIVIDNGTKKVQQSRLEKHAALLKSLSVSEQLERAAVVGVMTLVRHQQYPPGMLDQYFRQLYDLEVVSESVFLRWRDSDEQEGMGVALMSVKAFFKDLEEEAAGDDEEAARAS